MPRPFKSEMAAPARTVVSAPAGGAGQTMTAVPFGIHGGWLSTWAPPPDAPAEVAFALSIGLLGAALARNGPRWIASSFEALAIGDPSRRRRFLAAAALVSAFLSLGYIAFYLRGGPRAPDAPTYFLQGRALAHGHFAWLAAEPVASVHGVNLLSRLPDKLAGVFPPGFPLVLASGFLVGAPMVVGPVLAAGLAVATWWLTLELATSTGETRARAEACGRLAAGLSIVCAALRYHTADASPHGAAALAVAVAFAAALRGNRTRSLRPFAAAGCALGALAAVQPWSIVAIGAVVLGLAWRSGKRWQAIARLGAALPGVVLLLVANHAASGRLIASPVSTYCSMVGASPTSAHGWLSVLDLSAHRVRAHLLDVANFEPIALLPLVVFFGRRRSRPTVWWAALAIVGQLAVYAPFGTASSAPAAGCSVLADVLPLDHALVALAVARLFPRSIGRGATALVSLSLAGFAVHCSYSHRWLAASDIGRPRFEPDVPRDANVASGLLFFDDDAGYELANDPGIRASSGLEAVRMRGDDHDRLLYELLGRPTSHRYIASASRSTVVAWSPPPSGDTWTFEAESEWPPVVVSGGFASITTTVPPCASAGRALVLTPSARSGANLTIELPAPPIERPAPRAAAPPAQRTWLVTPRVVQSGTGARGTLILVDAVGRPPLAQWSWSDAVHVPTCLDLPAQPVDLGGTRPRAWLVLETGGGAVMLDRTRLRPR